MTPIPRGWPLIAFIITLAIGVVAYRLLSSHRLEQTAALFIGLPTILALAVLMLAPQPKSWTGAIFMTITIFLLISGMLLGEGFICVLMAAPIAYAVGLIVGLLSDWFEKKGHAKNALMIIPFAMMSLEGVHGRLSFGRMETITAEQVVTGSPASVEHALAATPHFDRALPLFLNLGFPRPVGALGTGLNPGDQRLIHFAGGEGRPGDLLLIVTERDPMRVRFMITSDSSHIAHWLAWKSAEVTWEPVDAQHTRVRWTTVYRRLLDPAWYFRPWERYAVRLSASYLIDTLAIPQ